MDEWPDIVCGEDENDLVLDEEILLSGAELEEVEREAFAALSAVTQAAAASLGNLVGAIQGFVNTWRVVIDGVIGYIAFCRIGHDLRQQEQARKNLRWVATERDRWAESGLENNRS
jgi:hypothetical protein